LRPEPGADETGGQKHDPRGPPGRLRHLALRGSAYELVGFGASQVIRIGSNMVMSRLLYPQAFGLVALVGILNFGLAMLSDVGIEPAVIQSPRGDDRRFLDTAWTLLVLRGLVLYAVAVLVAWPLAALYDQPELAWMTVVGSTVALIGGLHSTSLFTLRRRLQIGTLTLIDLGSQVAAVVVMIPWALLRPSPWPLLGGMIASTAFRTIASHLVDVGYRNRLGMESAARHAIASFGKWIFASSAVFFLSRQTDRLLLGRLLGTAELGIYTIALMIAEAMSTAIQRVTHGVLYPVLSRVRAEGDDRQRDVYYKARLALDAVSLPAVGALTVLGPAVIRILYDDRYAGAGWMLQALAVRVAMMCVLIPCETSLFSRGQTRFGFYQSLVRLGWVAAAVPIGWYLFGLRGFVFAVALSELPVFFVLWPSSRRAGILRPLLEARAAAFFAGGVGAGWLLDLLLRAWRAGIP
jgi:O-antigen/teichoic acid export membrane protein